MFYSLGNNWHCSWLSYVVNWYGSGYLMQPDGGWRAYNNIYNSYSDPEFYSSSLMQRLADSNGKTTGFIISYGNGAKDYYCQMTTITPDGANTEVALLTAQVDPFNHTNQFVYFETNAMLFLQYVIDPDGKTNTMSYNNAAFPTQITGVTDPFGHTAGFKYDADGLLTNIVDEIGMCSSFRYNEYNWITNLTTPYGTTTFDNATTNDAMGCCIKDELSKSFVTSIGDSASTSSPREETLFIGDTLCFALLFR